MKVPRNITKFGGWIVDLLHNVSFLDSYTPFQILQEFFPTDARKKQRLNLREDRCVAVL